MAAIGRNVRVIGLVALALAGLAGCGERAGQQSERAIESRLAPPGGAVVEPAVSERMQAEGAAGYLIYFGDRPDLSAAKGMEWTERGRYVAGALQQAAGRAQKRVRAYLDGRGVGYRSFWIDNIVAVDRSDAATLAGVLGFDEVSAVRARRTLGLIEPVRRPQPDGGVPMAVEPNLTHVGAAEVWASGVTGTGIVVANIDTGVRYTHQALVGHYRGTTGSGFDHDYNWWDPYGEYQAPADGHGHGSHTMGTIVGRDGSGQNQIGMAPGAQWIACRGCSTNECGDTQLIECAQFMAAPWRQDRSGADPDLRPHVVNSSWGDCGRAYDPWYRGVIDSWQAAGVYPVFSNGNASNCWYPEPPGCNTVGNPGRYGSVTGVGSSGRDDGAYAEHSNWGPTDDPDTINPLGDPTIKPQVLAPGVDIRSSVPGSDDAYEGGWSGTSMSAPHVTGLVALIWEAAPCLAGDYATTENIIETTAAAVVYASACGGEGAGNLPNNATGWGEIDAVAAVNEALGRCGPSGTLEGYVTETGGGLVAGAAVEIGGRKGKSGADGWYRVNFVPVGTHAATASGLWHLPATVEGISIAEGQTVRRDFSLSPRPQLTVHGTVRDGLGHGWPLYARVSAAAGPIAASAWTDPRTGAYSLRLLQGNSYTFAVSTPMPGYDPLSLDAAPDADPYRLDFALTGRFCAPAGYAEQAVWQADFESDNGGFATAGTTSWSWGEPTSGPGAAHAGARVWATNPAGNYGDNEDGYLTSAPIDLSAHAGQAVSFRWWHYLVSESGFDYASVEVSGDGGTNWSRIWGEQAGSVATSWTRVVVELDPAYSTAAFRVRFRFRTDGSVTHPGWYIDDVAVLTPGCVLVPGGLAAGLVTDAANGEGLVGARVDNGLGHAVQTLATPDDPALGDGLYLLFAPPGERTLTASKVLYQDASAGVLVTADDVVWRDLALAPPPPAVIRGVVRDGGGHDWPLYAKLTLDWGTGESLAIHTDPVTGGYEAEDLFEGVAYSFAVESLVGGYQPVNVVVTPVSGLTVRDFELLPLDDCTAPGYGDAPVWEIDFEAGDGGFVVSGASSWAWGAPTTGPGAAHSGTNVWATGLGGDYGNNEDGYLTSPVIDLSAAAGESLSLRWWQYHLSESGYDFASVEVSRDGGGSWRRVYGEASGQVDSAWARRMADLEPEDATDRFRIRFRFRTDGSVVMPGWYIDDVAVASGGCARLPGGLLAGQVTSAGTGEGLVGAVVRDPDGGGSARTVATPDDDRLGDGWYLLFAAAGERAFVAAKPLFQSAEAQATIAPDATTRLDFALEPAPVVSMTGIVKDGSGHGWPLYAGLTATSAFTEPARAFTDPATGGYEMRLYRDVPYTVAVAAVAGGYQPLSVELVPDADPFRHDFSLLIASCDAPGYAENGIAGDDFEKDDGGYTVTGSGSWEWGPVASGPGAAHSGLNAWGTKLSGEYGNDENSSIVSPPIDLSAAAGRELELRWWQYLVSESGYDFASIDVSPDDGTNWRRVYGESSGTVDQTWSRHTAALLPEEATPLFRVRFGFRTDGSVTRAGFYVDDAGVIERECAVAAGGFVHGVVSRADDGQPIAGATVTDDLGNAARTADAAGGQAGFYQLMTLPGVRTLTFSAPPLPELTIEVTVPDGGSVRQDALMGWAELGVAPEGLSLLMPAGAVERRAVTVANTGRVAAAFEVQENIPASDTGWLSVEPSGAYLGPGERVELSIAVDTAGLAAGDYAGLLALVSDQMNLVPTVTVDLTVAHVITVLQAAGGRIMPDGPVLVPDGGEAAFEITPLDGFATAGVLVDGVDLGPLPGYTFSAVAADHTLTALFTKACLSDGECTDPTIGCFGLCVADLCDMRAVKPAGTACGDPSETVCTAADTCDGSGGCDPNDAPDDTVCRQAAGECDLAEKCDGTGGCPDDRFIASGTACGDRSDTVCTDPDTCDGAGGCLPNHVQDGAGCRDAAGPCDLPESCLGGACPEDGFSPVGTICREAASDCDAAEQCSGQGAGCPEDAAAGAGTECRPAAHDCDAPETCDGQPGDCPLDLSAADWTACNPGGEAEGACLGGVCEELAPDDTCEQAVRIEVGVPHESNLDGRHDYLGMPGSCESDVEGPDAYLSVELLAGHVYRARLTPTGAATLAGFLWSGCLAPAACLGGRLSIGAEGAYITEAYTVGTAATFIIQVAVTHQAVIDGLTTGYTLLVEDVTPADGDTTDGDTPIDGDADGDTVADGDSDPADQSDSEPSDGDAPDGDTAADGDQPSGGGGCGGSGPAAWPVLGLVAIAFAFVRRRAALRVIGS